MKIIKRILSTFVGLAILIAAAVPSVIVSRHFTEKGISTAQARFEWFYKQEKNSIDVMYYGGSAVYKYDINVQNYNDYGFTSAGLCSPAQPFGATKYLIEETLKTQSPKLFVIEIRQLVRTAAEEVTDEKSYTGDHLETYYSGLFSSMKHSLTRTRMIFDVLEDPSEAVTWNFEFLRHHNKWQDFKSFKEMYDTLTDTTVYDETEALHGVTVAARHKKLTPKDYSKITDKIEIPDSYKQTLDELIDFIKEKDLNVLFISTPYSDKNSRKEVQNYIGEYLTERGMEYIDYFNLFDETGLNWETDYYDSRHVNLYGAEKWTRYFGEEIYSRIGKQQHSEAVDKQWKQAYKNWLVEREELSEILYAKLKKKKLVG